MHRSKTLSRLPSLKAVGDNDTYLISSTQLGKGAFGVVVEGNPESNPKQKLAFKQFQNPEDFDNEKYINSRLQKIFKNKCNIYYTCMKDTFETENIGFIVYDKAKGDLSSFIKKRGGDLYKYLEKRMYSGTFFDRRYMDLITPQEKYTFVKAMVEIMQFNFEKGIIHSDIKPENILVFETPEKHNLFLMADYGLSCIDGSVSKTKDVSDFLLLCDENTQINGTPLFIPPFMIEMIKKQQKIDINTRYAYDIYAMGCTIFAFLTGMLYQLTGLDIRNFSYPDDISYNGNTISKEDITSLLRDMITARSLTQFLSIRDKKDLWIRKSQ